MDVSHIVEIIIAGVAIWHLQDLTKTTREISRDLAATKIDVARLLERDRLHTTADESSHE